MNEKLSLSFTVATFVAVIGVVLFLRGMNDRIGDVERAVEQQAPLERGRPPGATPRPGPETAAAADEGTDAALASKDAMAKLNHLIKRIQVLEDDSYDTYNEIAMDLLQIKKELGRVKGHVRRMIKGLGASGNAGFAPDLPAPDAPLDDAARRKLTDQAAQMGVRVEDGKVTVAGFLNLAPNTTMPIEYFMARFPEASHETLVHIVGNKTPEQVNADPYGALAGLPTSLYKAMLAAGFKEGTSGHPDPDSNPQDPRWILPTGDTVYLYVRWENEGQTHVARATDWILDPSTKDVLPHDCLRFTGSMRFEDPETGDEALMTEQSGLMVSVWPNRTALIEVALESAAANNYQYNFTRIPKVKAQLALELIFSKTPIEVQGDGAQPPK